LLSNYCAKKEKGKTNKKKPSLFHSLYVLVPSYFFLSIIKGMETVIFFFFFKLLMFYIVCYMLLYFVHGLQMMEALGAIAAEPGEVPDCNCSFILFCFYFFTHIHTFPPPPQAHARTQGSICREKLRLVE